MSIQNKNIFVRDVMLPVGNFPIVEPTLFFKEALEKMNETGLGIVCITKTNRELLGIVTDGDIRRKLLKNQKPFSAFLIDDVISHAVTNPTTISGDESLYDAVKLMKTKKIWDLPVVNQKYHLSGLLHLHPAVEVLLKST